MAPRGGGKLPGGNAELMFSFMLQRVVRRCAASSTGRPRFEAAARFAALIAALACLLLMWDQVVVVAREAGLQ